MKDRFNFDCSKRATLTHNVCSLRKSDECPISSGLQLRHKIEHERNDCVDRDELDTFEPVGLAIPRNHCPNQHGDEERTDFGSAERQIEGHRRDEIAGKHQKRRDKQRDLDSAPQRDADRQI